MTTEEARKAIKQAQKMAIRSLEMWDAILKTLRAYVNDSDIPSDAREAYADCINLIEESLKEVVK